MVNSVKSFRNVQEDYPHILLGIKCLVPLVEAIEKQCLSGVPRTETRLVTIDCLRGGWLAGD